MTGFRHEALLYRGGAAGLATVLAPQVAATLDAGGTVAVAALSDRLDALRDRVGSHERLELLDMEVVGANPARIIPVWRDLADGARGPFLGVGEPVWTSRDADTLAECHHHEALINVAFADDPPWRLVCPYDVEGLEPAVIEEVHRTHPVVRDAKGRFHHAPLDPLQAFRGFGLPLGAPPEDATVVTFDLDSLEGLRILADRYAEAAGLTRYRRDDLLLAVTEAAGNSIRHGGGGGELAIWITAGAVVCQTTDAGLIDDPLIGRRRPSFEHPHGRGFWIMHQVCDLVQVRTGASGTTVRLTVS